MKPSRSRCRKRRVRRTPAQACPCHESPIRGGDWIRTSAHKFVDSHAAIRPRPIPLDSTTDMPPLTTPIRASTCRSGRRGDDRRPARHRCVNGLGSLMESWANLQPCIPKPSKICGAARSMRAVRVLDCLAPLKWSSQPRRRPGVRRSQASRRAGSAARRWWSSSG